MCVLRLDHILIALLCVNVSAVFYTLPLHNLQRARQAALTRKIALIKEHLSIYHQTHGDYPKSLETILVLNQNILRDPWGIQLDYKLSEEKSEPLLRSIGHDKSLIKENNRSRYHLAANGCLATLVLFIFFINCTKKRDWSTWQCLPLLFLFAIGFYLRLGGEGISPQIPATHLFYFQTLFFYVLLTSACYFTINSLISTVKKRDIVNVATLLVAPYAIISLLLLF